MIDVMCFALSDLHFCKIPSSMEFLICGFMNK